MSLIQLKDVYKIYAEGQENQVNALDGVTLSIDQGEFVAIIGTSGSGKSTLLNMLGGLDRPTGGTVKVDNFQLEDLRDEDLTVFRRQRIGFIFQNYNLIPYLTAYENIVLPVRLDGKQEDKALLREIVGFLDLEGKLASYPSHLSGGQQQRVAIARALALSPDILCFDEPTSALDPELTGEVLRVIRALAEQKTTMIIVTHEMAFARDVADQVVFMDGGVIVEQGDARQVIEHPREERTRQFLARYSEN